MDSVKALVEKLSEQLRQNEDKSRLIITVQQLLTELGGVVVAKPLPQNIYQETSIEAPDKSEMEAQVAPETKTAQHMQEAIETLAFEIVEAPAVEISQVNLAETKEVKEVKDHLVMEPIKDLRSAIGINDKFQFIQELFGGDEKSFEVGIKTINAFKIFPEAQFYIKRELREKNNWDEESNVVKQFDQLIKRRFS
jgi:hypothetical protein